MRQPLSVMKTYIAANKQICAFAYNKIRDCVTSAML